MFEKSERADGRKLRCPGTSGISPEVDFQQQKESMLAGLEFRNSGVFWAFSDQNALAGQPESTAELLERRLIVHALHARLQTQ